MHPHRLHVIQSIESVIQTLFLYQYLSDTSLLLFLSRSLFHLHCVNLREWHPARGIRFFAALILLNFGHAAIRHAWGTLGKTFILDFVGHSSCVSRLHFLLLDLLILILQLVTVYVAWETGHRDTREPDPLEPVESQSENTDFLDLEAAEIPRTKHPTLQPVFTLRSRHCWQRLLEHYSGSLNSASLPDAPV
ncbi:hypothetical protein CALVIDRAFT_538022 [Calocera viscosa TUFC12733]|uniref:DUF1746 domain-containing protein n=1 Tax=Calocera viscosa (strain TUFC12733) TaxID=1330018 RepID=A0A167LF27_CALVF|nr:hypothetical protein CALVIDRAFT_538022 [Calocera viscosa TUFC12733]